MSVNFLPDEPEQVTVSAPVVEPFVFGADLPEDASFLGVTPIATKEDGAGFLAGEAGSVLDNTESKQERKAKRIKLSKRMKKSMDKIKGFGGDALVMWFHDQSKENPEWKLDIEEEDWLKDSMELVFEVLDIEVQIEPVSATLTSIWWVLAYPFCTFLYLFFTKKAKVTAKGETQ